MNFRVLALAVFGLAVFQPSLKAPSICMDTDPYINVARATEMGMQTADGPKVGRSRWSTYLGRFLLRKKDLYAVGIKYYMALLAFMDRIEAGKADPRKSTESTFNNAARQIAVGEAESAKAGSRDFEGAGFEVPLKARRFAYGRLSILFKLLCSLEGCSREFEQEAKAMQMIAKRMLMTASIRERAMASLEGYGSRLFWSFGAATCIAIIVSMIKVYKGVDPFLDKHLKPLIGEAKETVRKAKKSLERAEILLDAIAGPNNEHLKRRAAWIAEKLKSVEAVEEASGASPASANNMPPADKTWGQMGKDAWWGLWHPTQAAGNQLRHLGESFTAGAKQGVIGGPKNKPAVPPPPAIPDVD